MVNGDTSMFDLTPSLGRAEASVEDAPTHQTEVDDPEDPLNEETGKGELAGLGEKGTPAMMKAPAKIGTIVRDR